MSKRYLKCAFMILLLLSVTAILFSCTLIGKNSSDGKKDDDTPAEKIVESIQVDTSSIPDTVYAGLVHLEDFYLIVKYNDGTEESVPMSEDYIAVGSRNKLKQIGTQQLVVVYSGCTASLQLDLLDPSVAVFTLVVEGGVPISVNGERVNVQAPANGVFAAEYTGGTVVVIQWTEEANKTFGSWEADGVSVDNQSVTTVHMNADHVYHAISFDIVYTVNFITYKDNYNIASKYIKRLYSSSEYDKNNIYFDKAPTLSMDDYVFAGWTASEVTRDQALSGNESIPLIDFDSVDDSTGARYVHIDRNITLYAVWTPIKLSFTPYTPTLSGYTQTSGYQVVRYEGTLTELVIPESYGGMPVLSVSRDTFTGDNAAYIESITVPSSVVEIEEGTFKNCSSLRAIHVAQGSPVYSGENGVLYKDERATLVAYPANKVVRTYEMESTVSTIASYAFYNAVVGQIVVSAEVSSIGDHAFDSVHVDAIDFSSTTVNKLNSAKSHIGNSVFNEQLSSLILTSSEADWVDFAALKGFGDFSDRFTNGTDVHRINTYQYSSDVVILFRIISGTYFNNTSSTAEIIGVSRQIKEINIPDRLLSSNIAYSVSSIGYYAFKDCRLLTSVTLPSNLERVSDMAFDDTPWAQKLSGNSIIANDILYKYLGSDVTYNLPSEVKRIAESAFRGNKTLEFFNVTSNSVLREISAMAFYGCENLISFSETRNDYVMLIKPSLLSIGAYAFNGTGIKYIRSDAASVLTTVREYAFADCKYLLNVEFSSPKLEEIDATAFLDSESILSYSVTEKNDYFVTYRDVLYKMSSVSTAALFAYPTGKMLDVFDPSVFTKKYVVVENGVFSVFGQEYTVESEDASSCVGMYTDTDDSGVETPVRLTLEKDARGAYLDVRVNMIGANALRNSNIGALVLSEYITSSDPILVPGLAYVSIAALTSMNYSYLFPSSEYEPRYVCFPNHDKSRVLGFFNSDEYLCDQKYVSAPPCEFFICEDNLYYAESGDIVLSRTPRNVATVTVPDVVVYNSTDHASKKIGSYAFGGWYLKDVTVGKGVTQIGSYAMGLARCLQKVVFTEDDGTAIPTVYSNSFGVTFNNGLLLYVGENMASYFIDKWNTNNVERILQTFTYYLDGNEELACPYLIEDNKPFAQLTYRDDNGDVVTVGNPCYGTITTADIERFYNDDAVQKEGYIVGGWLNEDDDPVEIGTSYVIPYNQILSCVWVPRVYLVYLNINSDFTPNFGVEVRYSTEKRMYYLEVEYKSDYEWLLNGYDTASKYLNGWKYSSSTGDKYIGVKGTWSLVLDRFADNGEEIVFTPDWRDRKYSLVYICEGVLSNQSVSVSYNEDYTLSIPVRDGYSFMGWYYIQADESKILLTGDNGHCKMRWYLTVSENDTYRIYPEWQANAITVTLYLDRGESEEYGEVSILYDSDTFVISLNEGLTEQQIALFSGWADSSGVIYTDSDGKAIRNWDKSVNSKLYAVWPEEVGTTERLIQVLTASMSVSVVLTADLTIDNISFGAINQPYTGVFNGNGHKITYTNTDDNTGFSGLFVRNDGTIKNLRFYVENITRNIRTVQYGVDNPVYLGTVCGINNGVLSNVDVEVEKLVVTVNSKAFCFNDVSSAYHVGIVCAQNNGKITGTCVYYYYEDTVYYRDNSASAARYYSDGEWRLHYGDFYLFENGDFVTVTPPYDEEIDYYKVDDNDFVIAKTEAKNDYDGGFWNTRYSRYYTYEGGDYINVTVPFDTDLTYYTAVEDIFKNQELFNIGTGTNKMSFTLKEHKTNN